MFTLSGSRQSLFKNGAFETPGKSPIVISGIYHLLDVYLN